MPSRLSAKQFQLKNTMPILNGILIIAEENFITLRATDLDIAIQCNAPADVAETGELVIADGKRFIDVVRQLPDNNINISLINDCDININYGSSSINMRGFAAEQFSSVAGFGRRYAG